ncbi:MAG: hypothetical protein LIQ26_06435 [Bacteroidota bacterium]|nr:hypothetical protein [Bacteroidota bacterium]
MPVDIFSIDQLYPTFTGEETNTEKIERLADYLYKLIESLRYTLYHLGEENFSGGFEELKKKIEADIGTQIDLSDYVRQEDLADYVTDTELSTELAGYATQSDLSGYAQTTDLQNYVPKTTLGDNSVGAGGNLQLSASVDMTQTAAGGITITASGTAPGLSSGIININAASVNITAPMGVYANGTRIG